HGQRVRLATGELRHVGRGFHAGGELQVLGQEIPRILVGPERVGVEIREQGLQATISPEGFWTFPGAMVGSLSWRGHENKHYRALDFHLLWLYSRLYLLC